MVIFVFNAKNRTMKNILLNLTLAVFCLSINEVSAQNVYTISSGEMIFSWAEVELTDSYIQSYPEARIVNTPVRFTMFFHLCEYLHMDLTNNIGLITGTALRNVGFITDEVLPTVQDPQDINDYQDYKIIRRTYTLGIPLALKLGSFKDNLYIFGGGEYEWAFAMKEKWWNSHARSGEKSKNTQWWPNNFETFLPSIFVGMQFPKGINLKFKYYLNDFVNHSYDATGNPLNISNLTRYKTTQTMYISLSWQLSSSDKKKPKIEDLAQQDL